MSRLVSIIVLVGLAAVLVEPHAILVKPAPWSNDQSTAGCQGTPKLKSQGHMFVAQENQFTWRVLSGDAAGAVTVLLAPGVTATPTFTASFPASPAPTGGGDFNLTIALPRWFVPGLYTMQALSAAGGWLSCTTIDVRAPPNFQYDQQLPRQIPIPDVEDPNEYNQIVAIQDRILVSWQNIDDPYVRELWCTSPYRPCVWSNRTMIPIKALNVDDIESMPYDSPASDAAVVAGSLDEGTTTPSWLLWYNSTTKQFYGQVANPQPDHQFLDFYPRRDYMLVTSKKSTEQTTTVYIAFPNLALYPLRTFDRRPTILLAGPTKVLFGPEDSNEPGDLVDIYDFATETWADPPAKLSAKRSDLAVVHCGPISYFAGGLDIHGKPSDIVDMYDVFQDKWWAATLTTPRVIGGAACGGFATVFAGGWTDPVNQKGHSNMVDYHVQDFMRGSQGYWDQSLLVEARAEIGVARIGDLVICAGGINARGQLSPLIDVFDPIDESWSRAYLSEPRTFSFPSYTPTHMHAINDLNLFVLGNVVRRNPSTLNFQSAEVINVFDRNTLHTRSLAFADNETYTEMLTQVSYTQGQIADIATILNSTITVDVLNQAIASLKASINPACMTTKLGAFEGCPTNGNNNNPGNTGAIVGAVIGSLVGVAAIAGALFYRKRRAQQKKDAESGVGLLSIGTTDSST